MMGAILLVARAEIRRRGRSLLGIGLLVVLFSSVVLVALVGAHRTSTALDRYRDWARSSDVALQGYSPEMSQAIEAGLAEEPAVVDSSLRYLANVFPVGSEAESLPDFVVLSDPDDEFGITIDRVRILSGRRPAPDAPAEIVINELAADLLELEIGDQVPVLTFSAADLDTLATGLDFPGFNGPLVELEVVGIGRSPVDLAGERTRTDLLALGSANFLAGNPGVGAWPPVVLVRLANGEADIPAVAERLQGVLSDTPAGADRGPSELIQSASDEYIVAVERSISGLGLGLLIFALTAAAAGLVAVGQAVARQISAASQDERVLASLGLPARQRAIAIALAILGVELIAVLMAAGIAIAASPLLPTGRAEAAEIQPGVWVDPFVLAGGAAALFLLLAAGSVISARRGQRTGEPSTAIGRSSLVSWMISTFAIGPTPATGLRRASADGPHRPAGTIRSAMAGVAIAAGGVLGAGVIVSSIDSLVSDPSNWGWTWSTMPDAFGDDPTVALADDPDLRGAATLTEATVQFGDTSVTGFSMTALKGGITFSRLSGRLPSSPIEVALGQQTLQDLGVSIGDSITALLADQSSTRELEVVGSVVLPRTQIASLDEGAVLTPDGLTAISQGSQGPSIVLEYEPGADIPAVEARLSEELGLQFPVFARPAVPGSIANIAQARGIAWALAVFFGLLGFVGLFHALAVSTRRDAAEFAVLRTIGMRRGQVRTVVAVEALSIATVGLVVGVPLGLIAGRGLWRWLVGDLGIDVSPEMPWLFLAIAVPAVLLSAAGTSFWPGLRAARAHPADQLRAE